MQEVSEIIHFHHVCLFIDFSLESSSPPDSGLSKVDKSATQISCFCPEVIPFANLSGTLRNNTTSVYSGFLPLKRNLLNVCYMVMRRKKFSCRNPFVYSLHNPKFNLEFPLEDTLLAIFHPIFILVLGYFSFSVLLSLPFYSASIYSDRMFTSDTTETFIAFLWRIENQLEFYSISDLVHTLLVPANQRSKWETW